MKYFIIILLTVCLNDVRSANILAMYPCPSISHQVVFRPLTLALLERGHHVTVLTPDPMYNGHENLTEIDVHDISYATLKKYFISHVTGSKSDLINQVRGIMDAVSASFEEQMKTKEVQELIKKKDNYDLIIIESIYMQALVVSHIFRAPTVLISSFGPYFGSYEVMGIPTHPILYHNMFRQRLYNLTLIDKITEIYNQFLIHKELKMREEMDNELLRTLFGSDIPPLSVLKDYVEMMIVNVHPIWEGNYPVPPNVIHVGGLHMSEPRNLPQDLQQYLDASKNGVIYFSFGTNVQPSLLPAEKMAIFDNVFTKLPYNVIWKRDTDNVGVKSKNVKVFKWLPQADLLRHPNIKLFITQGGLQSTDEAITAGVPLLGIPMLGDQWYNVEKYLYHGIGQRVYFEDLNEELLENTILEVAEGKRYRDNIIRLRSLMGDQPQAPLARAVWWIEYVLRNKGAKHMRAPTANISWIEFLQLDLIIFVTSSFFIIVVVMIFVVKCLISIVNKLTRDKKLKKS